MQYGVIPRRISKGNARLLLSTRTNGAGWKCPASPIRRTERLAPQKYVKRGQAEGYLKNSMAVGFGWETIGFSVEFQINFISSCVCSLVFVFVPSRKGLQWFWWVKYLPSMKAVIWPMIFVLYWLVKQSWKSDVVVGFLLWFCWNKISRFVSHFTKKVTHICERCKACDSTELNVLNNTC